MNFASVSANFACVRVPSVYTMKANTIYALTALNVITNQSRITVVCVLMLLVALTPEQSKELHVGPT